MSTATFPMFKSASVEELPRKACIGFVEEIKDGKVTAKGIYSMIPFVLAPTEAGQKAFGNFLFRPEWLEPGFDPDSLKQFENGKSLNTVYRMNVCGTKDLSVLAGLAGSEEAFHNLAAQIFSIEGERTPEAVTAVLREFINDNNPECGYILKQKTQKDEETGKYSLIEGYEIGGFFWPTEEEKKRLAKSAAAGKLILTFEV